jgi:crossover junction endodeoxyribonuclease RuvC
MTQSKEVYRILGIDPGTNYTGYGVLEVDGRKVSAVVMGEIDLHKIADPYEKLRYIFDSVSRLVKEYRPREVALESPFFGQNVQSMLKLGRAQGVAMAAALTHDKQVFEYAPSRVKLSIAGSGSASKEQVAAIVKRMLKLDYIPRRLDATDGMAVAMCHYFTARTPISQAMGSARVKGLGGGKKAAKGSSSWEVFLKQNPNREIK